MALASVALSLAGCGADTSTIHPATVGPATIVRPADLPDLLVECRTEPLATPGDCEAWALGVVREWPQAFAQTDRLLLSGPLGPGHQGEPCTAAFVDPFGQASVAVAVECWVPSGG